MYRAFLLCTILSAAWTADGAVDAITALDTTMAPPARFA